MRHTGGLLRRAVSMVVQLGTCGLEARLRIVSGCPTIRDLTWFVITKAFVSSNHYSWARLAGC